MYGTIVLAVDEFEHSKPAAEAAKSLAIATNDAVVVLHIYRVHVGKPAPATYQSPEEAQQLVDSYVAELTGAGVKARGILERHMSGDEGEVVAQVVAANQAGLVVVGTRARSELASLAFGSVSHDIVHRSAVPVMVVPSKHS